MESLQSLKKTSSLLESLLCCHLPSSPQELRRRSIASVSNRRSFADVVWSWKMLRWRDGRGGGRVGDVERGIQSSFISGISVVVGAHALTPITRIPLSERQIYTIVKSWKTIQGRCIETGMKMFLRMFEQNPEVKETFEKFRMMDTKTKSAVLETHGMVVMNALDEIITNLDDPATVIQLIIEQGRSHARFGDDLTEQVFWAIEKPFLQAVQETIGDAYTPALQKLYTRTIRFILTTLIIGFRQSCPLSLQHSHQPTTSNMPRHNDKKSKLPDHQDTKPMPPHNKENNQSDFCKNKRLISQNKKPMTKNKNPMINQDNNLYNQQNNKQTISHGKIVASGHS